MKTTVDISDALLERAKRHARRSGKSLRTLIEDGLRRVLSDPPAALAYRLADRSVGVRGAPNPLEERTWDELRAEIYAGR